MKYSSIVCNKILKYFHFSINCFFYFDLTEELGVTVV